MKIKRLHVSVHTWVECAHVSECINRWNDVMYVGEVRQKINKNKISSFFSAIKAAFQGEVSV